MIYVIAEQGSHGFVKIGFCKGSVSGDGWIEPLRHRLRDAQLGNFRDLVVIAVCDGERADEHALHVSFAKHRVLNEWFHNVGPVAGFVNANAIDEIERTTKARDPIAHEDRHKRHHIERAIQDAWIRIQGERAERDASMIGRRGGNTKPRVKPMLRAARPRVNSKPKFRRHTGLGDEWRTATCERCGREGHRAPGCRSRARPEGDHGPTGQVLGTIGPYPDSIRADFSG